MQSTHARDPLDSTGEHSLMRRNADVEWDGFAPEAYWTTNYRNLRMDDRQIIHVIADFFSSTLAGHSSRTLWGIDVGSGANLYPALSLLPWCARIALTDRSRSNVRWLRDELRSAGPSAPRWEPYWAEFAHHPGYREVADPWARLTNTADIAQGNVLYLPPQAWDIGTMFFVAESMTSYRSEFEDAVRSFLGSLVPGAPFAAAFMDKSLGYMVERRVYPAVREVDRATVGRVLAACEAEAVIHRIDVPSLDPLRDGYDGMLVAVGRVGGS